MVRGYPTWAINSGKCLATHREPWVPVPCPYCHGTGCDHCEGDGSWYKLADDDASRKRILGDARVPINPDGAGMAFLMGTILAALFAVGIWGM